MDLSELRRRAEAPASAADALEVNRLILELAPDDGPALNRLGRAHQDLGQVDEALETFRRAVELDPTNDIARRRIEELVFRHQRPAAASSGRSRLLRDPEKCLRVLDGPWKRDCIVFLGDALRFALAQDSARTVVRDVPKGDYFYVAGGAHAAAGPWKGTMDCYADGRGIPRAVIDRVVEAGGTYRPHTNQGVVPFSIRLEIPFALIGELHEALMPAMHDHIREAIAHGHPQHAHLHHPGLARRLLEEPTSSG